MTADDRSSKPRFPGIRVTTNGNQLVAYHTEARITDGGCFFPITPSTEMGEMYQGSFAEGKLNVFGRPKIAIEAEGEHAAQGGAIAFSVAGKRTVNFTSGQGIVYGVEQYYHAPGKLSTMVLEVAARALTKHALNVHCGHDDIYACLDAGWIMLFAKDAQQAADQAVILRRVTELALNPGINIQDGFLTSHLERTFLKHESELLREFLGAPDDWIESPTPAQRLLFGPKRRRVPQMIDLKNPILLGPVQNQEHYMGGVVARRDQFSEAIPGFLEEAYRIFGELTGRRYGFLTEYKTQDAETVFVSLGSAAENIEAAIDELRAKRGAKVGSIHVNVLRPFPEAAIVKALAGKKRAIVLERTDESLAGDNPLARDIRGALNKALANGYEFSHAGIPALRESQTPRIFQGVYGLGSRDFRPEGVLGAYEFAKGEIARADGKRASDGISYFVVGVSHPYEVRSKETPSLLPQGAIAVRFHSIGGWGMITTGKNMGEVLGEFGDFLAKREGAKDEFGRPKELIHISANPKYGSEKKGSPTSYFLVVAPERVRVNCDLRHVQIVLCCDPKAFTHTNPLDGIVEGGAFLWESEESPEAAWERIPAKHRRTILEKKIRVFVLPGFEIARKATLRKDLQLRMQGNAFLGGFFRVSSFLKDYKIDQEHFHEVVRAQYVKKFGRFGEAVVSSNMEVMKQGFERVREIVYGKVDAADKSQMRGELLMPSQSCGSCSECPSHHEPQERAPLFQLSTFDNEFRANYGYDQPATALASVGVMAAGTGAKSSKYVARRETPVFIAENCTQCMACIAACPDTALPNTAQDISEVLKTVALHYVSDKGQREIFLKAIPKLDAGVRAEMSAAVQAKQAKPFPQILRAQLDGIAELNAATRKELMGIVDILPMAYFKVNAIFATPERKAQGGGGLFSIFVSDLCKGCGECVHECGDHQALVMAPDGEELNARILSASAFLDRLPDTPAKYLGLYDSENPEDSKSAVLRNHLMEKKNYYALVSGDGACAGCGEKSALRAIATLTEAYMRPMFRRKSERLLQKVARLEKDGATRLAKLKAESPQTHQLFCKSVAHILMGLGGETDKDTDARMAARGAISDEQIVKAIVAVMRQDATNHEEIRIHEGRLENGMAVMAMAAHTGCNTVFGSTPPSNPHPYPWMNSLFQDGATIGWLLGESLIQDHARVSVVPERLADALLEKSGEAVIGAGEFFDFTHFQDALMTDLEIAELPKIWVVGGDGGMGDIGFQNVSKVVLQNRPNVKMLMLDTQVYSNTGGQNSDSSPSPGGFDMNQIGAATQGKQVEKKSVSEILISGHGSPFVAQVSMANAANFYKAVLDGLEYRGTAFLQVFTSCQPEHGVADDMSAAQAKRIRDSRGMPEFVFQPSTGESYAECINLKGNPTPNRDWWEARFEANKEPYKFTVAHYAVTEARFRNHFKKIAEAQTAGLVHLDDMLLRITQDDVVHRRHLRREHRSFIPDFGVYILAEGEGGKINYFTLSRQMVLYCVERRKAWRLLQSKAGIVNPDYQAQKEFLAKLDAEGAPPPVKPPA